MGLQIIYGRAGSGKSEYCYKEIAKDIEKNEKIFLITPEQFSFTAEKKLMEAVKTEAVLQAEVVHLSRLAKRVIKEIGIKDDRMSKCGKAMLISHILTMQKKDLKYLSKSEENIKINQYEVSDIVHSRLREILELSKKQINLLTKEEISYIIVTGGITEIDGFNLVFKEVFGKDMVVSKVSELGVRNNSFSSALGFIKLYNAKLKFREKLASTVSEEEQELLFNEKKKIDDSSIIGKVYSYFFDN